jgi:hypothetical protein
MTSNIEKIIAIAPTFIGATIDVQWQSACGRSMRYVEKADVDQFDICWNDWSDMGPCIRFWTTNLRRELHFLPNRQVEELKIDDTDTEFIFPVDAIQGVWNIGMTTQMRILKMKDSTRLFGPMRVVLTQN